MARNVTNGRFMVAERNQLLVAREKEVEALINAHLDKVADEIKRRFRPSAEFVIDEILEDYRKDIEVNIRSHMWYLGSHVGRLTINYLQERVALAKRSAADIFEQALIQWLLEYAFSQSEIIVGSLKRLLTDELVKIQNDGAGEAEAARRLSEAANGSLSRSRAAAIARTELHTAAEWGAYQAALATGLDMVKEWSATEDRRTRPDHANADGQTIEMDAEFEVGDEHLFFPGDPKGSAGQIINCRCATLYWPRVGGEILK